MRLLNIELKKLVGNNSFWVFSIIFLIFLPVVVLLIPSMAKVETNGIEFYPLMPKTAETTWYYVCLSSSYFSMFVLAFILIYHISNEYSYRTVRQNIIDGYTRTDFLLGKLSLLFLLAFVATAYVLIVGLVACFYFDSIPHVNTGLMDSFSNFTGKTPTPVDFGIITSGMDNVIVFFIQIVAYFSFAGFISFLVKRGALAIVLYFVAFIAEKIIGVQLMAQQMENVYDFFPLRSMSVILPNVDLEIMMNGMTAPGISNIGSILMVFVYIILLWFFTRLIFLKRDIS